MEAPGTLVVAQFPSVIGPVCVVKGVSAAGMLKRTPCVEETPCVSGVVASVPGCVLPSTPCMSEQPCVSERPSVRDSVCEVAV